MEENLLFEATEKEYKMYKGMKYIFKEKKSLPCGCLRKCMMDM